MSTFSTLTKSFFLLLLCLLPIVLAVDTFFGCYTGLPSTASRVLNSGSATDCQIACQAELQIAGVSYTSSYWSSTTTECYCATSAPAVTALATGTKGTCGANYDARVTRTSFTELALQCYSTVIDEVTQDRVEVDGPDSCFSLCRGSIQALYWADTPTDQYYCYCSAGPVAAASADCGLTSYFAYSHTAEAAASQLAKRNRRALRAARKAAQKLLFCPKGMSACLINGTEGDAFECLDVKSELESCGGCMSGQFGLTTSTKGTDCSTMSHIRKGGSTCLSGTCTAFACKRGYTIFEGKCRKSK